MTLSGLGLLTNVRAFSLSLLFLYLASFKTVQLLYSGVLVFPFISCLQNLHSSMIILPSNIRIFPVFLADSATDKPVNRNIHALPLKQLNGFALRGVIFRDIHKNQGRSSSNSGYRIQKICGWKIYSRTRTFRAEVHKSNIRVKKLAQQV